MPVPPIEEVRGEFGVHPRDRYKRLLAYVSVGEIMINAKLVRQGYAQVVTFLPT